MVNLKVKILGYLGVIEPDEPIKFPKRNECDNCFVRNVPLFPFNNTMLCEKCLDIMKKRFPSVRA